MQRPYPISAKTETFVRAVTKHKIGPTYSVRPIIESNMDLARRQALRVATASYGKSISRRKKNYSSSV